MLAVMALCSPFSYLQNVGTLDAKIFRTILITLKFTTCWETRMKLDLTSLKEREDFVNVFDCYLELYNDSFFFLEQECKLLC